MIAAIAVLALDLCIACGDATGATGPRAVAQQTVYPIPASITSDCSVDVTAALQQWFASVPDGSTIVFGKNMCYNVDSGLVVTDRRNLTFEGNGSTFQVFSKGGSNRSNWTIRGGTNITLRNMIARGANPNGGSQNGAYDPTVEWQHAYRFEGTQTGTLDSVQAYDVYGDFVEAQPDWTRAHPLPGEPARNITVRNSHFARNGRQGIGLTHVDGFVLQNTYIGDVQMSAIDLEPVGTAIASNVKIDSDTFGLVRHAILVAYGAAASNVAFVRNTMVNPSVTCVPPVFMSAPAGAYWTGFTFQDNSFQTLGNAFDLTRMKNVDIERNAVLATNGGCGNRTSAVLVTDAHTGTVSGNTITKTAKNPPPVYDVFKSDTLTTGFTISGNSMM